MGRERTNLKYTGQVNRTSFDGSHAVGDRVTPTLLDNFIYIELVPETDLTQFTNN